MTGVPERCCKRQKNEEINSQLMFAGKKGYRFLIFWRIRRQLNDDGHYDDDDATLFGVTRYNRELYWVVNILARKPLMVARPVPCRVHKDMMNETQVGHHGDPLFG